MSEALTETTEFTTVVNNSDLEIPWDGPIGRLIAHLTNEVSLNRLEADRANRSAKAWEDTAYQFARNEDYYRGLLDECAKWIGAPAYIADDGSVSQSPLRSKIPELVRDLFAARRITSKGVEYFQHGEQESTQ